MAHSHAHGAEPSWRPRRDVRRWLSVALIPFAVATVAGLVTLWPSHQSRPIPLQYTTYGGGATVYETGRVLSATNKSCTSAGTQVTAGSSQPTDTGSCSNALVLIQHGVDANHAIPISDSSGTVTFHVGDQVRVARGPVDPTTHQPSFDFDDFVRDVPLGFLAFFFAVLLIVVARWRGLAALLGVGVAYLVLVKFMLPALLDGSSPIAVALVGSAAILFVVLYLAHGFSARTSTALLGTLGALAITAGLAAISTSGAQLTGRSNEVNNNLLAAGIHISITGLILCGLIVGTLGVLNDVTITQASSVWELSEADPRATWPRLFTSGMRIGRDHIASTVYTLVFAYAGASLPLLLLFSVSGRSVHDLLTGDEIGGEIVRSLVGGAGLVLAVPLTTLIAAVVAARPHEAPPENDDPDAGEVRSRRPRPRPTPAPGRARPTTRARPL
jgi:uncharacterized membrane protein